MELSSPRVDRDSYPVAVRKAADYLTEQFQGGSVMPARVRFDVGGRLVATDAILVGTFAFFVPDVQGRHAGGRDEDWPWVIYAEQARQAYNFQIGDSE